jgi:hypothetical protein
MEFLSIVWDDSEGGNVGHIAEHGLTPDEVEEVLRDPKSRFSRSGATTLDRDVRLVLLRAKSHVAPIRSARAVR